MIAIAETATGIRARVRARRVAARGRCLLLGAVDLSLELGLEPRDDGLEILFARSALVVDSAAAGHAWRRSTACGRRSTTTRVSPQTARSAGRSDTGARRASIRDRWPSVNEAYSASPAELERARRVVAAYETAAADGRGAVRHDGEMIDLPVVERARQLLAETTRSVGDEH